MLALALSPLVTAAARADPVAHPATRPAGATAGATATVSVEAEPAKLQRGAWLGVTTSKASQAVLDRLKIGSGLVVDAVGPASPAADAGLKPADVIQKFDDQLLINPAQLQGLIRLHSPGDAVSLTVFHDGTPAPTTVKLVEHDVLPIDVASEATTASGGQGGSRAYVSSSYAESSFSDGQHVLTAKQGPDGVKTLTVRDARGTQLFSGPVDTDAQKAAIPTDLRPLFDRMEKAETSTPDKYR